MSNSTPVRQTAARPKVATVAMAAFRQLIRNFLTRIGVFAAMAGRLLIAVLTRSCVRVNEVV